jgi:hypothetical protein
MKLNDFYFKMDLMGKTQFIINLEGRWNKISVELESDGVVMLAKILNFLKNNLFRYNLLVVGCIKCVEQPN